MITLNDAKKIVKIVELAEGGCSGCMESATSSLNELFPEFYWKMIEIKGFSPGIDVELTENTKHDLSEPKKYSSCGKVTDEWTQWEKIKF